MPCNMQEFTRCLPQCPAEARPVTQILKMHITWCKISWDHFQGLFSNRVHLERTRTREMQTQFCLEHPRGRDHMGTTLNLERTRCEVYSKFSRFRSSDRPMSYNIWSHESRLFAPVTADISKTVLHYRVRKSPLTAMLAKSSHWPIFINRFDWLLSTNKGRFHPFTGHEGP